MDHAMPMSGVLCQALYAGRQAELQNGHEETTAEAGLKHVLLSVDVQVLYRYVLICMLTRASHCAAAHLLKGLPQQVLCDCFHRIRLPAHCNRIFI